MPKVSLLHGEPCGWAGCLPARFLGLSSSCMVCPTPGRQVWQPPAPAAPQHGHACPVSQQACSAPDSSMSPVLKCFSQGPSKLLRTHCLAGFAWSRSTSRMVIQCLLPAPAKSSRFGSLAGFSPAFSQAVALPCLSFREFSLGSRVGQLLSHIYMHKCSPYQFPFQPPEFLPGGTARTTLSPSAGAF